MSLEGRRREKEGLPGPCLFLMEGWDRICLSGAAWEHLSTRGEFPILSWHAHTILQQPSGGYYGGGGREGARKDEEMKSCLCIIWRLPAHLSPMSLPSLPTPRPCLRLTFSPFSFSTSGKRHFAFLGGEGRKERRERNMPVASLPTILTLRSPPCHMHARPRLDPRLHLSSPPSSCLSHPHIPYLSTCPTPRGCLLLYFQTACPPTCRLPHSWVIWKIVMVFPICPFRLYLSPRRHAVPVETCTYRWHVLLIG